MDYNTYINSNKWKARRIQYYKTHKKHCVACTTKENIHLHHLTYERMGAEHDDDLMSLCEKCHSVVHQYQRETKLELKQATERAVLMIQTRAVLAPVRRNKKRRSRVEESKPRVKGPPSDWVPAYRREKQPRKWAGMPVVVIKK